MKRMTATLQGVYVCDSPDSLLSSQRNELEVVLEGVPGDRHFGFTAPADGRYPEYPRGTAIRNHRQVSLVSVEELAEVARRLDLPEIRPEWLGANLLVAGIQAFSSLPPTTRLFFPSGAALQVTAENHPCTGPGKIIQSQYPDRQGLAAAFVKQAMHLRGLVAVVERAGSLCSGDHFEVETPVIPAYTYGPQ